MARADPDAKFAFIYSIDEWYILLNGKMGDEKFLWDDNFYKVYIGVMK